MRILAAATIAVLMTGSAWAQTTPSTTDAAAPAGKDAATDPKQSSPGATGGAMQNQSSGVATSPQDVQQQQQGKGTAAAPMPGTDLGTAGDKTSPGTVGASPGDDPSKPK